MFIGERIKGRWAISKCQFGLRRSLRRALTRGPGWRTFGTMSKTLFEKIIAREIPATIVYEDDQVLAFRDIKPQAPVHVLIIPKKPIERIERASPEDQAVLGHLLLKAAEVARQLGLAD